MSSSRAKQDMSPSSHLKSTLQELKKSVVDDADHFARGDSMKSSAQAMKEKNIDSTVKKGGDKSKGTVGVNRQ
ncbi:hypothetical protein HO173_000875 [Letharia columbiana]|uniref:Uncharacterized protein n=1 Tax=Letharia columbiana TaxID=112416 RepID=A0A8H6G646_9LECA|nr:uncharacterized protein HO173_000875 [Letharia columbiana]KAF6241081.1 hypothetical protein HO173_000875 [Letharia columbiana]